MASKTITIKPAAGPLTVTLAPPNQEPINPPMTAAIIPDEAGAPEARATPIDKGKATKATENPAEKSGLISLKRFIFTPRFSFQHSWPSIA